MKAIEKILTPTDGYINSFVRNTVEGWWELEVGIPKTWVFDGNDKIGCEVVFENEVGKLISVVPQNQEIVIDDLIDFVEIIILTNQNIALKETEFKERMEEMKSVLELEAKKFYTELDTIKENSFQNRNKEFAMSLEKPKKPRKPRTVKAKSPTVEVTKTVMPKKNELLELDGDITTVTNETTVIETSKK